jgi:hypothetical protein
MTLSPKQVLHRDGGISKKKGTIILTFASYIAVRADSVLSAFYR